MSYFLKIFSLFLIIAISTSCEKKFLDYRNKFIGKYSFEYHFSFTVLDSALRTSDTTITYDGLIRYGGEKQIKIQWFNGTEYEFDIDKSGIISKCRKVIGEIQKKDLKIEFDDDLCSPGPLGANSKTSLSGKKK